MSRGFFREAERGRREILRQSTGPTTNRCWRSLPPFNRCFVLFVFFLLSCWVALLLSCLVLSSARRPSRPTRARPALPRWWRLDRAPSLPSGGTTSRPSSRKPWRAATWRCVCVCLCVCLCVCVRERERERERESNNYLLVWHCELLPVGGSASASGSGSCARHRTHRRLSTVALFLFLSASSRVMCHASCVMRHV